MGGRCCSATGGRGSRGSTIYGHKMIVIIASYYYYCYQSQCQDLAQCTRRTGKAAKAKKRAWHKEGASKTARRERERERETLPPTRTMSCAKIYVLFVYLFMQCFVNCSPHTPAHTFACIAVAHANLYTCTGATINIRRKISHFSAFCLPAFIFAGLSRVAIITARSPVIYTKCISFIAATNPQSKISITCPRRKRKRQSLQ